MNLDVAREVIRQDLERSRAVNPSTYRIGNKIPDLGLYEVLGMDGSVIGYGRKIYNAPAVYGDTVRATKPYGSNVWSLDRLNLPIEDDDILQPPQDGDLEPPGDPPEDPPTPPEDPPTPSNNFPTKPPDPVAPPTFFTPPPKPPTSPDNCEPPPPGCDWQDESIPCNGEIKGFVDLPNGSRVILCCDPSVDVPTNLGCAPSRFTCSGGSCFPDQNGIYSTFKECDDALDRSVVIAPVPEFSVTIDLSDDRLGFGVPSPPEGTAISLCPNFISASGEIDLCFDGVPQGGAGGGLFVTDFHVIKDGVELDPTPTCPI